MKSGFRRADLARGPEAEPLSNPWMFFRRWMANPLQMGSVIPSSPALCRLMAERVSRKPDEAVLEIGAGTGVISRALLESGVPADRLFVVEIDPDLVLHLRRALPGVQVLEGDARRLPELVPAQWQGRIGTVICGIPMVMLPLAEQRRITDAIEAVAPGRGFLHFTYCVTSPLPGGKLRLAGKREAWTPLNFPPASVWRYAPA